MIAVLRDQHMRQQSRPRQAALDRTTRRFRLHDAVALRAAQLRAHMTNHHETGGHVLQHLRHILAQLAQFALALRAHRFFRLVPAGFARQMIGQGAARGFRCTGSRRGGDGSRFRRVDSFSLRFDSSSSSRNSNCSICRCQLLRLPPKLHAMQLGQQQLQMLDLALARE